MAVIAPGWITKAALLFLTWAFLHHLVAGIRYLVDDDRSPYVWKTTDHGRTWTRIVSGIPADDFVRPVATRVTNAPWHQQHGWKAADFFADPQVVALGDAIVANDLDSGQRVVFGDEAHRDIPIARAIVASPERR